MSSKEETNVRSISVRLGFTVMIIAIGLQLPVPCPSWAEQEQNQTAYYTIQIGTYVSENSAEGIYQRLISKLDDSQLQDLRIEKIKNFYVVRIGRYDSKDNADKFYPAVRAKVADAPLVTKTRVGTESIIREYRPEKPREQAAAELPPQKVAPLLQEAKVEDGQREAESLPMLAEKKKQMVPPLTVKRQERITAEPPEKEKKISAQTVRPESVAVQEKCVAKPVLVLADVSGSMLEMAKAVETQARNEPVVGNPITKVTLLKQLLLNLSPQMAVDGCRFGVYLFRFFPGTHLLYESLLKIDSYDPGYVKNTLQNYFMTDVYEIYTRRSPITDVLQQLDIDILWKMSGRLTILLISDGILTNNGYKDISESQMQTNKNKETLLLAEVRWLMKKYGSQLTIHSIYIAAENDKSLGNIDPHQLLLQDIAELGGGSAYTGMDLLKNEGLINALYAEICCTGN